MKTGNSEETLQQGNNKHNTGKLPKQQEINGDPSSEEVKVFDETNTFRIINIGKLPKKPRHK